MTPTTSDQGDRGKGQGQSKPKDELVTVIVNGTATPVAVHGNPTLLQVVTTALQQTQNSGQPMENWELRGPDDVPIVDLTTHIKKLVLEPGAVLYLSLRAGIGG